VYVRVEPDTATRLSNENCAVSAFFTYLTTLAVSAVSWLVSNGRSMNWNLFGRGGRGLIGDLSRNLSGWGWGLRKGSRWLRRCTTFQVKGSNPDEVIGFFFNLPNSSSRTLTLRLTQPLTEMSTRNLPGGKNVAGA
jgi:hypothetical protein